MIIIFTLQFIMGKAHGCRTVGLDYEGLLCVDTPCKTIKIYCGWYRYRVYIKNMVLTPNVDGVGWKWAQTMDTLYYTIWYPRWCCKWQIANPKIIINWAEFFVICYEIYDLPWWIIWNWILFSYPSHNEQRVCHNVALPCTWKSTLRQKRNYGNSNIFHHVKT
jgi:hypothetical protein